MQKFTQMTCLNTNISVLVATLQCQCFSNAVECSCSLSIRTKIEVIARQWHWQRYTFVMRPIHVYFTAQFYMYEQTLNFYGVLKAVVERESFSCQPEAGSMDGCCHWLFFCSPKLIILTICVCFRLCLFDNVNFGHSLCSMPWDVNWYTVYTDASWTSTTSRTCSVHICRLQSEYRTIRSSTCRSSG